MEDVVAPAAPPGWYPDTTGYMRWWDGHQWGPYAPPAYAARPVVNKETSTVVAVVFALLSFAWLEVGTVRELTGTGAFRTEGPVVFPGIALPVGIVFAILAWRWSFKLAAEGKPASQALIVRIIASVGALSTIALTVNWAMSFTRAGLGRLTAPLSSARPSSPPQPTPR